jgi:hypothetical protein
MTLALEKRDAEQTAPSAPAQPSDAESQTSGPPQGPLWPIQKLAWVFAIFALLMIGGLIFASLFGVSLEEAEKTGFAKHTVLFWRMVSAVWAATILVTAALSLYVSTRSDRIDEWWRLFWTFGYIALLVHLYWAIVVNAGGNWDEIFNSPLGVGKPEHVVDHPRMDLILAALWGIDVALSWLATPETKLLRWYRSALHIFVFGAFFGAATAAKTTSIAHGLGYGLVAVVTGAAALHLIRAEVDEKSLSWAVFVRFFWLFNKFIARWDSLPTFLAVLNLIAVRARLRARNLYGVSRIPVTNHDGVRKISAPKPEFFVERQTDGLYDDLDTTTMGCSSENDIDPLSPSDFNKSHPGARFGRNVPLSKAHPEIDAPLCEPNPRLVSDVLLARPIDEHGASKVAPAETLNLLAGAWIQFQTHDWFNHGTPRSIDDNPIEFDVDTPDWPDAKMRIRRTRADPTRDPNCERVADEPPTYVSAETHWWDASQIYGGGKKLEAAYRAGTAGKLKIDPKNYRLPIEGDAIAALPTSWWVGLGLMHVIFTLEHNAICDYLHEQYPEWRNLENGGDDQYFRVARLVNSALMAKIHTIEWTPAIIAHPALLFIMHGTWWGAAQEFITRHLGRISEGELISGIPGSRKDHFGVDFSLTEEFVSVYRMHPLLPETLELRRHADDQKLREMKFISESDDDPDLATGPKAMSNAQARASFADILYSFGMENPGALQLRNFPNWMRRMRRRHGPNIEEFIDLAAIDILRDRERGVPRYNRFRELFDLPRKSFEQMSKKPELVKALREVYGHPDKVDLMVGMFAEEPPVGFGFSDTAFRVFILMAGRRLKSDRLFTDDYRPEIYTQAGLNWINDNTMITILLRHFPELTPALRGVDNAFAPWGKKRAGA